MGPANSCQALASSHSLVLPAGKDSLGKTVLGRVPRSKLRVARVTSVPRGRARIQKAQSSSRAHEDARRELADDGQGSLDVTQNDKTSVAAPQPSSGEDSDEEVTALLQGVNFAQLCDDFQCVSSPAVERTARLVARDIHDVREDRRTLSCFAINVVYKDPLRSFQGRERYKRPSWILNALEKPHVDMLGMEMSSPSTLIIKWRLRGDFRLLPGAKLLGASLDLLISSTFTLNQISGQVLEHRDEWDLSRSSPQTIALFYSSRLAWSTVQAGTDLKEIAAGVASAVDKATNSQQDSESFVFRDPSGDPRKFFVQNDPNQELYQVALAGALLYLLVQFLLQVL